MSWLLNFLSNYSPLWMRYFNVLFVTDCWRFIQYMLTLCFAVITDWTYTNNKEVYQWNFNVNFSLPLSSPYLRKSFICFIAITKWKSHKFIIYFPRVRSPATDPEMLRNPYEKALSDEYQILNDKRKC